MVCAGTRTKRLANYEVGWVWQINLRKKARLAAEEAAAPRQALGLEPVETAVERRLLGKRKWLDAGAGVLDQMPRSLLRGSSLGNGLSVRLAWLISRDAQGHPQGNYFNAFSVGCNWK